MLKRLYIENFALVDKLEIDFETGMNVLTGETGAGKSIIVGAIGRLLGEKGDKDDIRSGTKLAVIEGEFDIAGIPEIEKELNKLEVEPEKGGLILRKEIHLKGNSRSLINGQAVTLTQLRSITKHLAELLGQHSHQQLLDEDNHQRFLDRFSNLTDRVEGLQRIFCNWENIKKELAQLESCKEREKNERELLLFQKEEIEKARIRIGEETELLAEKKILDSSRLLGEKSSNILSILERDENSALDMLQLCRKELAIMAALDNHLEGSPELLENAIVSLQELRSEIESYRSSIPDDPERQEQINLRLDEIFRLKKKYGGSEEAIIETLEKINEQLSTRIDVDEHIKILGREESRLFAEYEKNALEITKERKKGAKELSGRLEKELKQLGIDSARFEYEFIYLPDMEGVELVGQRVKPGPSGLESGRFLISANPGEPLKPLAKTASGGEISRIMLALKAVDRQLTEYKSLLVLDEIDAGIGGITANAVARRLAAMASSYQILVITHLHQIASVSNSHYAVEKIDTASSVRKIITVRKLKKTERQKEIARMISLPEKIRT